MNRNAIVLFAGLLVGPALAQGAIAQGALPAITEAEAHAHRRRRLHLLLSAHLDGHHAEAIHEHRTRERVRQRSDEHVRERPGVSPCRFEDRRAGQLRYALFRCVARSHQGTAGRLRAGHRRTLLSPADARHVDGCFCIPRMAHDRYAGGQFSGHAAWMERHRSRRDDAYQRADAVCLGHRPDEDGRAAGL